MTWILPRQLDTLACALDTEALSLDCTEQSEICARSLFVRSKPSPLRTWSAKWKRDSWTRHLFGRILRPSLGQRFVTEWTSLLEATHASHSVQPGSAEARTTLGTCGPTSQREFDFSDPAAASLKTSKDISAWGCPTSSKTWQEWVIERRGEYSARLNAVRLIKGSGCSSWPTASARDWKDSAGMATEAVNPDGSKRMRVDQLARVVFTHGPPVPASSSTDGSRQGLWQTATVSTGAHKQKDGSMTAKLDQQVKQWPTPRTQMSRPGESRSETTEVNLFGSKTTQLDKANIEERVAICEGVNHAKLNPRWVETLMGLPVGWTMPSCASPVTIERMSSDYSVTVLSQQQQNEPSGL